MAQGILQVPAPMLPEVIDVIRAGLLAKELTNEITHDDEVYINLKKWCSDMEIYLGMLPKGDDNGK
jgi:hypothetical protein